MVLASADRVVANNPHPEDIPQAELLFATETNHDTPANVLDLAVVWQARKPGTPTPWLNTPEISTQLLAQAADRLLAAAQGSGADSISARAALTVAEEDTLWRARRERGWRVDRNAAHVARQELEDVIGASARNLGLDLTRNNAATLGWLRAHHVVAELTTNEAGFAELSASIPDDTTDPQLQGFLHVRALGSELNAIRQVTKHLQAGRLYATLDINRAATGRALIRTPNLNAIKRSRRGLLLADAGNELISADMQSAEVRVLAALLPTLAVPRDDAAYLRMARTFADEVMSTDPYRRIAEAAGPDVNRDTAKRALVARIYGEGFASLCARLGADRASRIRRAVDQVYPVISQFFERARAQALRGESLVTLGGRPLPSLTPETAYRAANYLVQGSARDAFGVVMRRAARAFSPEALWLCAHDELIIEVSRGDVTSSASALEECFAVDLGEGILLRGEAQALGMSWAKA
ncbi:DNA polymerase [Microbacterium sp. NPDC079995]|uniref:DNA polymerase n=1 Tax=unclassified Microbacterium TaxID=2609290 RepID=UPI00344DBC6C